MGAKRKKSTILVIGASCTHDFPSQAASAVSEQVKPKPRRRKKKSMISLSSQGDARVLFFNGIDAENEKKNWTAAEKVISRCSAVLLLQDAVVGVALQAAEIAKKHHVKVLIDPEPMLDLKEKIKRASLQITLKSSGDRKKHAVSKKWRKRRSCV
ncbi:hypothetical protein ABWW58_15910 [Sporolactobacillus sp. STCC-11]|uniref:hypothetical protein n=1 Tax=Sporolactobacillus caesalpiniae TaxID=3230362 RepID=UPI00339975CB